MKHRNIDKQIRDRINGHESEFSDQLWSNIENHLDKNPKRVLSPFFVSKSVLLIASLALISGLGMYLKYANTKTEVSIEKPAIQIENSKLTLADTKIIKTNQIESSLAKSESETIKSHNSVLNNAAISHQNISIKSSKNTHKNQINSNSINLTQKQNVKNGSELLSIESLVTETNLQKSYTSNLSNTSSDELAKQNFIFLTPEKIMSVYSENSSNSLAEFFIPDPKRKCPKFYTNVPSYFIEAFIAPDFNHFYYATNNSEYTNYLDQRSKSESPLLSYSLGLRAGMEFRNGLLLKTGISFSNIRYALDFQQKEVEILKYKVVPSDTIHGNGSVAYVFDTIAYIETGIRTVKHYNSLKTIELPLWVGYQINSLRWSVAFNAGISVQLLSMQQGKVLSASAPIEPVEFTNSIEGHYQLYQRTWGVGLMASTQFSYKIFAGYSLLFEPYMKYYPNSITQSSYPLRQKVLIYGANMGVKLSF